MPRTRQPSDAHSEAHHLPNVPIEPCVLHPHLQGFPFDDFDLNDVMLPESEGDFGYPSDDDELDEEEIVTETGFGSVIGERTVPAVYPLMESSHCLAVKSNLRVQKAAAVQMQSQLALA